MYTPIKYLLVHPALIFIFDGDFSFLDSRVNWISGSSNERHGSFLYYF